MKIRKRPMHYKDLSLFGKLSRSVSYSKTIKNLVGGNWIDLMCGYNADLIRYSKAYFNKYDDDVFDYHAVDIRLNNNLLKQIKVNTKEMYLVNKLPYDDNYFDNVTIIDGLEHLNNPEDIITECYRILKKKGVFQLTVPTWFGKPILEFIAFRLKDKQAFTEMNDHKMYYDERQVWPMLVSAGFKPELIKIQRIKFFCSLYIKSIK